LNAAGGLCYPYSVFAGTHVRLTRRLVFLTPIALAAGLLITAASVMAADAQWTSAGAQQPGSPDRPVWSIAASPQDPAVLLEASQGHGVLRSADSGATWLPAIPGVVNAWVVRFDPQQSGVAYAGTQADGFYRSTDAGKTWTSQTRGLNLDVRSIDAATGVIIAGTAQGVYDSTDGGTTWQSLGLSDLDIAAVALLSKPGGYTIFAGADNGNAGGGYLLKSEGLTGSWTLVRSNVPADAIVVSLAVASAPSGGTDPPVLAGTSQGLFRSDDRGLTWINVSGLPSTDFNLALFNPANPDQIYVGSDGDQGAGGVFRSLDRGASWNTFGGGLPARPRVTALALQPNKPPRVIAATWNPTTGAAGVYRAADPSATIPGATATVAPSTTASLTASARPTAPAVVVPRQAVSTTYTTYVAAGVVLLALLVVVFARRWRARRDDHRIYGP
jgi:hypothetical protein